MISGEPVAVMVNVKGTPAEPVTDAGIDSLGAAGAIWMPRVIVVMPPALVAVIWTLVVPTAADVGVPVMMLPANPKPGGRAVTE